MTRLHLVRHGPTHARSMVGWSDLPADLSDQSTIDRLAAHLPEAASVVSSDLSRASATADAIQGARRRLPHHPDLREINFGTWELRRYREIEAEEPELIRAYWTDPGDVRPPGGESWNAVCNRVNTAIDGLIAAHAGGDLIVVAHFGVILTQVQRAMGIAPREVFAHRIDNLSVTEVHADPAGWRVAAINHCP